MKEKQFELRNCYICSASTDDTLICNKNLSLLNFDPPNWHMLDPSAFSSWTVFSNTVTSVWSHSCVWYFFIFTASRLHSYNYTCTGSVWLAFNVPLLRSNRRTIFICVHSCQVKLISESQKTRWSYCLRHPCEFIHRKRKI